MDNECIFSPDRVYRYVLHHRRTNSREKACLWIGLNPSVGDEQSLDNTLTRIKNFSSAAGYNGFYMTNLFALVSTNPAEMRRHPDPVGLDNDRHISEIAEKVNEVVVCWGCHGGHLKRDFEVLRILAGRKLLCLSVTRDGFPSHPLYLPANRALTGYDCSVRSARSSPKALRLRD